MFHRYCELPDLVQSQVLSNLSFRQRLKAERVCKDFQKRLRHPGLWKGVTTVRLSGQQLATNRPELGCVLELPRQDIFWASEMLWPSENDRVRQLVDRVVIGLIRFLAGKGVRLESLELERLECMAWRGINELSGALTDTGTKLRRLVLPTSGRFRVLTQTIPHSDDNDDVAAAIGIGIGKLLTSQMNAGRLEQLAVGSHAGSLMSIRLRTPEALLKARSGIRFLSVQFDWREYEEWLSVSLIPSGGSENAEARVSHLFSEVHPVWILEAQY